MRDIGVLVLFVFIVTYTMRRPFIGVSAWIWVALAYPAGWAWGFSTNFRMNLTVAVLTYIGYIFMKDKPKTNLNGSDFLLFFFWLIALISCSTSNSLLSDFYWQKFSDFSKVLLLYLAVILIIKKKVHIDTIIWSIVLSVSGYAGMEAVKFLISGGGHKVAGFSGHILGDRNDLVVAINMSLPLILYLIGQTHQKLLKFGLIGLAVLSVIAVIGSYSRGGLIGLVVIAIYFYIKSNRKIIWTLLFMVSIPVMIANVPDEWTERMDTVSTATSEDNSFIGRLWAWKISVKIANNNVFGNGFMATQDPLAWHTYRTVIDDFGFVSTPPVPETQFAKAAHNIYFQVLGDMGYIGLITFLLILWALYRRLIRLIKKSKELGIAWCQNLSTMLLVSMVGYAITGANVSLAYFDLLFAIIGITHVIDQYLSEAELVCTNSKGQL